jgi:thymidine phosphorylase
MGVTHDALYKWLATGKMPASLIPAYEMACGIDYVSRWLAISAGKLVIDIPTGKTAKPGDIQELQDILNSAMGNLIRFYSGRAQADETLAAIQSAMEGLALHRGNVAKHAHPELDFGGEE